MQASMRVILAKIGPDPLREDADVEVVWAKAAEVKEASGSCPDGSVHGSRHRQYLQS